MRKFNRLIAVVLSLCMAFAVVADSAVTVFADGSDMTIIVTHWHADGTKKDDKIYLKPYDNYTVIPNETSKEVESFSGYAVSAGQNAVTFDADNKLHVKYRPDTRLVKIEVFYSAEPQKVLGLDFTGKDLLTDKDAGTTDKDVAWPNPAALGGYVFEPQPDSTKIYNTSLGLHTDKTVTALKDAGEGTREFEVKLESWYAEKSYAEVGMVLDASGSMAFASEGVEPIKVDGEYDKNTYLTLEQVNGILTKENTDNSKLGYSDYTYYVYDARSTTKEFVPLGYWDGNLGSVTNFNVLSDKLIGHYTFDNPNNRLENSAAKAELGATAVLVNHPAVGTEYSSAGGLSGQEQLSGKINVVGNDDYNNDKKGSTIKNNASAYNLRKTAENYGLLLDAKPTGDAFTISFAIKQLKDDHLATPSKPAAPASLFTVGANGEENVGYRAVRADGGSPKRLKFGNYKKGPDYINDNDVFNLSGISYKFITFVINGAETKLYIDGAQATNEGLGDSGKGTASALNSLGANHDIVFGGYWDNKYDGGDIYIDEIFVYDCALESGEVKSLYDSVKKAPDVIYLAKYSADGEVIAEAPDGNKLTGEAAKGWYYVNSLSDWIKTAVEKFQTAKQFRQLKSGEVAINHIDYKSLPESIREWFEDKGGESIVNSGNTDKFIYNGSKDFTVTGVSSNLYYYQFTDGVGELKQLVTDITAANVALTGADDRQQFVEGSGSPVVFFVDEAGYLRCFYNNGNSTKSDTTEPYTVCSYVYSKIDDNDIKYESLQYAIGSFVSELHAASPKSRVSAVRFSTKNIKDPKQLVLLDWTTNAEDSVKMLSLATGGGTVSGSVPSVPPEPEDGGDRLDPLNQYNYIMTGGTYLYTGLQAYEDILHPRTEKDSTDEITSKKYIIVFTDGKDDEINRDGKDPDATEAKKVAEELKEKGYTIYVVLFTTGSFTESDSGVRKLMSYVAGNKETTDANRDYDYLVENKFIFTADNAESLMEAFTGEILGEISSSQKNYAVQDYIDPRFDIEANGTLYKLGPGGNVTYGTESETVNGSDSSLPINGIKDKDGISAALYYDDSAKAYYLKWNDVVIPGCTVGDESIAVWSSSFKIVAKEDFIGGNVVLTNGIAENMNYVYSTEEKDKTNSGVDHSILGAGAADYEFTSKGFPRTTVNVKLLEPKLTAGESIIYLGEDIEPEKIINSIKGSDDYDYYWEYLDRYDSKNVKDADTSYNALIENGTLELPYSYLEKDGVLAGTSSHQDETFGTITYELKATDSDDASLGTKEPYTAKDLKTKTYTLSVKFDAEDLPADNSREKQISDLVKDGKFKWDEKFKPTAGTEQTTKENTAAHTIETVRGEIVLGLKINLTADQLAYLNDNYPGDFTYNADVFRGETKVGTLSLKFGFGAGYDWTEPVEGQKQLTVYATSNDFTPEDGFAEKLQKGTYSVRPASDVDALKETLLMLDFSDIAAEDITADNIGQFETSDDPTKAAPKESKIGVIMLPIAKTDSYAEFKLGRAEYAEPAAMRKYTDDRLGLCMITVSMPGDDLGTSSLVVTKKITGTEEPDTAKEFNFTLKIVTPTVFEGTLTCEYGVDDIPEGIALIDFPASGTLELGTDGLYHFSLKHNQKITINGIPVGSTYTVAEEDYSSEGYATTYANARGKITVDGAKADVINALGTGKLTVEKTVTGDDVTEDDKVKQFSFTATFYIDGTPITDPLSYTKDGVEHEFTNGGSFTLADGESVTITGIPDGSTFEITETQEEGFEPAIMNPADGKGEITAEAAEVTVTVENKKTPSDDKTGSVTVIKTVTGDDVTAEDLVKQFNFTAAFYIDGTPITDPLSYTKGGDKYEFTNGGTFTLAHGESVTITGIPDGSTFEITETQEEGFEPAIMNPADGKGEITAEASKITVTVENKKTPSDDKTGSVTVIKTVTGDDVTAEDLVKQFSFTAAFYIDGTPITDPLIYTKGGDKYEFTNGGSFTLANGESVTITGIPDGADYIVAEEDYSSEGYETTYTNESGKITAEASEVTVTVENRKASNGSPQLPPIQPQPQLGALVVKKTVAAGGELDRQFTFTFTFTDQTGAQLAGPFEYVKSDGTVSSVANGGQIMLRSGESVSFSGLPEGTRYSVKETGNEGYVTNYALNDNTAVGVITTETANVEFINTPYVAPDTPGPQQPGDRPPLIPEAPKYGSLSIEKIVFESDTDDSFDFVISLKTPLGASVSGTFPYVGSSRGYVFDGCTVSLRGGEKIVISGIPQGTVYTVTEITPENYISISENSTGMIPADFTSKVVYTNIKSVPTEQAQSSADDAPEAPNPSTGIGFGALLGFISSVFAAITRRRPRSSKN